MLQALHNNNFLVARIVKVGQLKDHLTSLKKKMAEMPVIYKWIMMIYSGCLMYDYEVWNHSIDIDWLQFTKWKEQIPSKWIILQSDNSKVFLVDGLLYKLAITCFY